MNGWCEKTTSCHQSDTLGVVVFSFAMTLIDSERAFQKRCDELHDGLVEKLRGQNISSFSTLAFSLGSPEPAKSSWGDRVLPSWQMPCSKLSRRLTQQPFSVGFTLSHAPCSWQK
jgi:hypothetical protein